MADSDQIAQNIEQFLQQETVGDAGTNHAVTVTHNEDGTAAVELTHEVTPILMAGGQARAIASGVAKGIAPFLERRGLAGADGSKWYDGPSGPSANLGKNGDYYLVLDEDDTEHPRPTRWYVFASTPDDDIGYANDLALRTDTGDVYERDAQTWGSPIMRLSGGSGGTATALKTTGADVVVSGATPPVAGQVLMATSATAATWQDVQGGSGTATALKTTGANVVVSGAAPPVAGQVLKATSATAAAWVDEAGGVPPTRTVNGHALSADVVLTASDVGADASGTAAQVQTNLTAHANATGTSVHGLGTASTHAATDFDAAGAASAALTAAEAYTDAALVAKTNAADIRLPHGFPVDTTGSLLVSVSYSSSTRQVTITANSGGTFDVWHKGVKSTVASPHVSDAHAATEGGWFFYWDGAAFVWSQTAWVMTEASPAVYVYWSSLDSAGYAFLETHTWQTNIPWHKWAHETVGALLVSGGLLGDYSLGTDTNAALQFSIGATKIADEDLEMLLGAKSAGAGFTVWYRSGASGYYKAATGLNFPFTYGTYPQINSYVGGVWGLTDLVDTSNGSYTNYYVMATPAIDANHRFVIVPSQTSYTSQAAAAAEQFANLSLGNVPFVEFVPIAQVTVKAKSSFTNTPKAEIVQVTRISYSKAQATSPILQHNALSGLQGGTGGEEYHLTAAQNAFVAAAGTANGAATLDGDTKVPVAQIPPVAESMLAFTDVATGNASTTQHGLMAKLSGNGAKYIGGDGLEHTFSVSGSAHSFGGGDVNDSATPKITQMWQLDVSAFPEGTSWYFAADGYGSAAMTVELWDLTSNQIAGTVTIPASTSPAVALAACTLFRGAAHFYEVRFYSATEGLPVYLGAANLYHG